MRCYATRQGEAARKELPIPEGVLSNARYAKKCNLNDKRQQDGFWSAPQSAATESSGISMPQNVRAADSAASNQSIATHIDRPPAKFDLLVKCGASDEPECWAQHGQQEGSGADRHGLVSGSLAARRVLAHEQRRESQNDRLLLVVVLVVVRR